MSDPLSSDVLESQFGPTKLEVLRQDDKDRVILTKIAGGGQILELSRVSFRQPGTDRFPDVHKEVVAGKSMGKAFRDHGLRFKRQVRAVYSYDRRKLPENFRKRFDAEGSATVIDVSAMVGPDAIPYADILEVYSPSVSWPADGAEPGREMDARLLGFDELLTESRG